MDAELSKIYGTTKEANEVALAARIAAAVLSLGLAAADKKHVENKSEEREHEHEESRDHEAHKMEAMIEALKSASVSGQILARAVPAGELDKVAFGAFMGNLATGAGKLMGAVPGGKALVGALTPSWKTKALATAGTLGAGYLGYKGVSALRDYANNPHGEETWGSKRPLQHNVNEFGVPSY
jgi:hypothetical protein